MNKTYPSLWQLRVFESVARLENVSRASRELLRSQPAITASIANLEGLLGAALFDRTTTGTYPTPIGIAVLVRARRILEAAAEAISLVRPPEASPGSVASRITRTQMRCIVAIAEAKTFSAAARAIGVSKSSLQRAARQLEENVGGQLYRHTATGVAATAAGLCLASHMERVMAQTEAMVSDVQSHRHAEAECITIGVLLLDPTVVLAGAIKAFVANDPGVRVVVVSGGYDDLVKKLDAGQLDLMIGILKGAATGEIEEEALYREEYCVVARKDHPLSGSTSVSMDDLRNFSWILPQHGSPRRLAFEQLFSDGPPPPASVETYALSTVRSLMSASDMLSVLSWTETLNEESLGILAKLAFIMPTTGPIVGITTRKVPPHAGRQVEFVAAIRDIIHRLELT